MHRFIFALALALALAAPAAADFAFTFTGTVAGAEVADDGRGCRLDVEVETVAGTQQLSVGAYERGLCERVGALEDGQRVEGRGFLFINALGLPVPVLSWVE